MIISDLFLLLSLRWKKFYMQKTEGNRKQGLDHPTIIINQQVSVTILIRQGGVPVVKRRSCDWYLEVLTCWHTLVEYHN
jgi:hypothetical protein